MIWWRKKKYLFVIEPKRKETKKERGRFAGIRSVLFLLLGIFVVISSVEYEKNKLRRRQAAVDILHLKESADHYFWEQGKCPDSLEDLVDKGKKEAITDPWGKRYDLICPAEKSGAAVDIVSAGPDRNYHTVDDLKI